MSQNLSDFFGGTCVSFFHFVVNDGMMILNLFLDKLI